MRVTWETVVKGVQLLHVFGTIFWKGGVLFFRDRPPWARDTTANFNFGVWQTAIHLEIVSEDVHVVKSKEA